MMKNLLRVPVHFCCPGRVFVFVATMRFDGWRGSAFAMFCIHWPRRHKRSSSTGCRI